ncbi:MAG: FkbM family methyltransferase, partial [Pseudomonadota bacterium]
GHDKPRPALAMKIRPDGRLDRHSLGFMLRYLRQGDAVLDIGASTGTCAIAAGRLVGPAGRVDAFEPSPTIRARLIENIGHSNLKSVVVIHNLMAGATAGLGRFVDGTGKSGRRRPPLAGELATRVIGVEMVRLEQFIGARRVALMCLDIAGGEFNALRGAEAQLRMANPPAMLLAIDSALTDFGVTADLLVDWLDERGYEITIYDVDRNMIDYPEVPWRQRRTVLAMARGARNSVLRRLADNGNSAGR